ncbi:MAG: MBL fold metallo-hydrolase [Pseudomonadota bacterium]
MKRATPSKAPRKRRWPRAVLVGVGGVVIALGVVAMAASPGPIEERIARSPAWDGNKFVNTVPTTMSMNGQGGSIAWRFLFERNDREPSTPLPTVTVDLETLSGPDPEGVRATWMGHSSVFLEVDGVRVLTDPVWGDRASPVGFAGPRRFHPPPVALEALPLPDVVLISHDHYDHLDEATIRVLARRGARFIVPLGVGAHLRTWGVAAQRVQELDWWQQTTIADGRLTLVATPARHFSGRGLLDRNRTLWASWVLLGNRHRVYFGGDSGLFDGFSEIGTTYGPFDLTLLEIGAYDPAWGSVHMGPEGALEAHRRLRGKVLLPIHWGTFNLGLHPWYEPPEQLLEAARRGGDRVAFPRLGETLTLDGDVPKAPWWRAVRTAAQDS